MSGPEPEPKETGSRRMIVWLVIAPTVLLLLAFAGAHWEVFHLAYCRHLMRSSDAAQRKKGLVKLIDAHLNEQMPLEEMRRLIRPATLEASPSMSPSDDGTVILTSRFYATLCEKGKESVTVRGYANYDEQGNLISLITWDRMVSHFTRK